MYDVLYFDHTSHCRVLATGLSHDAAVERARSEARTRRAGRMFLAGSDSVPRRNSVVIIRSGPS
jgi:hypothetical protein